MNEEMELSEHSPEQLVALIQQGHPMYFEELFCRFLPLVKKFNKAYYLRSLEQEDFWQEARMVLHKAVQSYVPEKGLQFASFYKLTLKHHIFSLIRKESASGYFDILSDFEQAVFIRFINGSDFQTIAEELDCEMTSIKNAYDRCHRKMKRLLE